jgi:hypothetical protein
MWGSTQFRAGYKPPKFQIVVVPDCYNGNYLISPGWSNKTTAAADTDMGIAQLSNHMLIPPDGLTFQDNPKGELFGYSWMSLPLAEARKKLPPTGNQHWTLFLSLANFKGPLAFIIPETWSKISKDYKIIYGRGLDAQEGNAHGGAQEFNTVPFFEVKDAKGVTYSKIPSFIYPVDEKGRTVLMQDVRYYSNKAISDAVGQWRKGGPASDGKFDTAAVACFMAPVLVRPINFRQSEQREALTGIENVVETTVIDSYTFGLQWKDSHVSPNGLFPRYYKDTGSGRVAVSESAVPEALRTKKFIPAVNKENYSSPVTGAWTRPASSSGPYYTKLADGSTITYYWIKFIDQPSLQQYSKVWSTAMKTDMQLMIEKIHSNWGINQEYMPAPRDGKPLVKIDPALLVTPPKGFEIGYVPIVTAQEIKN